MSEGEANRGLIGNILPMEFITSANRSENPQSDSLLMTTLEYLLGLNWPVAPKPPPQIDVGTCIENFVRNIVNKDQLKREPATTNCFVETGRNAGGGGVDYSQLLQ